MPATTAKTAMQMPTVSQSTKSILSPSFERFGGSQGRKRATAVAIAAATSAIVIKRTIAPVRAGAEPTQRLGSMRVVSDSPQAGTSRSNKDVEWDSEQVCFLLQA